MFEVLHNILEICGAAFYEAKQAVLVALHLEQNCLQRVESPERHQLPQTISIIFEIKKLGHASGYTCVSWIQTYFGTVCGFRSMFRTLSSAGLILEYQFIWPESLFLMLVLGHGLFPFFKIWPSFSTAIYVAPKDHFQIWPHSVK